MKIKVGQVWKRYYGEGNSYNGEIQIRGFVDTLVVVLIISESGKSRYDTTTEKVLLSDIKDGCMTLIKDVPEVKEPTLTLNEKATKKLEYITGAGFIRDFPNSSPSLEWVGAVLDFLEETNVIKIR